MKAILNNYLQYNLWANEKICKYLAGVNELDIASDRQNEFMTIKKIIMHIADAEQTWLARLDGKNVPHMHNLDISGSFAGICGLLRKNSEDLVEFIDHKGEDFFQESTE